MISVVMLGFIFLVFATALYIRFRIGSNVSLTLLLFSSLLLIHGIPLLVYLYLTGPETLIFERSLEFVDREAVISTVLIAVALMFASLMLGVEFANIAFLRWYYRWKKYKLRFDIYSLRKVVVVSAIQKMILWMIVLVMLGVSFYESHFSNVIEFYKFNGSEIDKTIMRREFGGAPYYLYNVLLYSIAPFFVMISYCNDIGVKNRWRPSVLTIALFIVVLLGKFGTLSKAPPIVFILQLLLLHFLLIKPNLNFKLIMIFLLSGLILFAFITRFTFSNLGIYETFLFLYYRVFDVTNEVLLEYFSAIPTIIPHSWSNPILKILIGGEDTGGVATHFAVAEVTRQSLLSSSNAMFIGDAWAQFSWFGVILTSIAAGFLVRVIDLYGWRNGYTDQTVCLVAGCSFGIMTILSTSFTTGLITGGLAILPLLSIFFVRRSTISSIRIMHKISSKKIA